MTTYWMPVYGTGCRVGCSGSVELIDSSVMAAKGLAAAWYWGFVHTEALGPAGPPDQPYFCATSVSYCFEVAQDTNFHAAPESDTPCGMPSAQVHSQPEDLVRF